MTRIARPLLLLAALFALLTAGASAQLKELGDGGPGPMKAAHLTAEMQSLSPSVSPGGSVMAGLVITLDDKWHVYWINAGDSGNPPTIAWTLPDGVTADPMQFPAPSRLPLGPLMDFGYEDEVAFPVLIHVAPTVKPGPIHLDARITWLVCREVCIPGKAQMGIDLNVAPGSPAPVRRRPDRRSAQPHPRPLPAEHEGQRDRRQGRPRRDADQGRPAADAEFYPFDPDQIQNAADQGIEPQKDGIRLRIKRAAELTQLPANLHGVIKLSDKEAYEVTAPVVPGEVAPPPPSPNAPGGSITFLSALGLAFFGGIILNLMPCVFPVLFLKGLALVQLLGRRAQPPAHSRSRLHPWHSGLVLGHRRRAADRARRRQPGRLGIPAPESPIFLTLLAAASSSSRFHSPACSISAFRSPPSAANSRRSRATPAASSPESSPPSSPRPAPRRSWEPPSASRSRSPRGSRSASSPRLRLGLAAPYLLLSAQPAWTRMLPRPGAWMEIFKQITAVIFFATVIWLTYVYGALFAAGTRASTASRCCSACFLVLDHRRLGARHAGPRAGPAPSPPSSSPPFALAIPLYQPKDTTLVWAPYSQAALDAAREGRPSGLHRLHRRLVPLVPGQ